MNTSVKESVNSKKQNPDTKHAGNVGHYENAKYQSTKSMNNRNGGRRRNTFPRHKIFSTKVIEKIFLI